MPPTRIQLRKWDCCAAVLLLAAANPRAAPVFVDFGSAVPSTGTKVNNLTNSALNAGLTGLKDNVGAVTGISLLITDNFHATSNLGNGFTSVAGAAATAGFTAAMARDYFLVNNSPLASGGEINSVASLRFSGLVAGQSYLLTIFSSRADPAGPRRLNVTLEGVTEMSGFIDATNNNSNVLELTAAATAGGTLNCYFEANSDSGFAHVNALKLTQLSMANSVPGALDVAWAGAPRVSGTVTGSYVYNDADGDAESGTTTHWELANDASGTGLQTIPGATGTTYVLQATDAGKYLRYVVTPGAAAGSTPGFASSSAWRGPVAAASAGSSFHVGNSFTRWGNVPQQLVNLASGAGGAQVGLGQLSDGQDLAYHWANRFAHGIVQQGVPSAPELATGTWDALVL
ncbi:MAG: hypothetical protein RLZZ214_1086, partial [Verrucomicrobiota bacterium]